MKRRDFFKRSGLVMAASMWAYLVSAKGMVFDEQCRHMSYDIGRCVKLGESMGFKGIYSVEQWASAYVPPDTFEMVRAIIAEVVAAL